MKIVLLFVIGFALADHPNYDDIVAVDFCTDKLAPDGAPLCSKADIEDQQPFDENVHEEQLEIRSQEMLVYFGIADDNYISDITCQEWTEEKRLELSNYYKDKLVFYCEDYNLEKTQDA